MRVIFTQVFFPFRQSEIPIPSHLAIPEKYIPAILVLRHVLFLKILSDSLEAFPFVEEAHTDNKSPLSHTFWEVTKLGVTKE